MDGGRPLNADIIHEGLEPDEEERAARREEGTEAKGGEKRRKEGRETPVR